MPILIFKIYFTTESPAFAKCYGAAGAYTELLFIILLFADPGGIGSAFHRAEAVEK